MAKKDNPIDKMKEGVSVKEIENFSKRYSYEILLALAIVVATVSAAFDFFSGPRWSVFFCGAGALLSVLLTTKVSTALRKFYEFFNKQEKSTQLILGIVRVVVALFLPFIIFCGIGLLAGIAMGDMASGMRSGPSEKPMNEKKGSSDEEEHL